MDSLALTGISSLLTLANAVPHLPYLSNSLYSSIISLSLSENDGTFPFIFTKGTPEYSGILSRLILLSLSVSV